MAALEVIGLFLIGIVTIALFLFQGNLWNPWNGKKQTELLNKYHDWSKVDNEMKPRKVQKQRTLIALLVVWVIGLTLQVVGMLYQSQ